MGFPGGSDGRKSAYNVGDLGLISGSGRPLEKAVMSDSATPWTVVNQAPLSLGFSRQEHWSGLPSPSLGDLPNPVIESRSPALQADSLPSELPEKP